MLPKCRDFYRGPGRPRVFDPSERETIILDAAERVILAKGLGAASMATIAKEAGMSKRTLYEVFDSKAALFAAIIRRIRDQNMRPLTEAQHPLPLADRLRLLLTPAENKLSDRLPTAILRAVIAEAERQPDLAREFLAEGPYALFSMIRVELDRSVARKEIEIRDTEAAARLMADMAHPNLLEHLVLPHPSRAERTEALAERVNFAIGVFLEGICGKTAQQEPPAIRA